MESVGALSHVVVGQISHNKGRRQHTGVWTLSEGGPVHPVPSNAKMSLFGLRGMVGMIVIVGKNELLLLCGIPTTTRQDMSLTTWLQGACSISVYDGCMWISGTLY